MSRPVADVGWSKNDYRMGVVAQLTNGHSTLSLLADQFTSAATVARIASHHRLLANARRATSRISSSHTRRWLGGTGFGGTGSSLVSSSRRAPELLLIRLPPSDPSIIENSSTAIN